MGENSLGKPVTNAISLAVVLVLFRVSETAKRAQLIGVVTHFCRIKAGINTRAPTLVFPMSSIFNSGLFLAVYVLRYSRKRTYALSSQLPHLNFQLEIVSMSSSNACRGARLIYHALKSRAASIYHDFG